MGSGRLCWSHGPRLQRTHPRTVERRGGTPATARGRPRGGRLRPRRTRDRRGGAPFALITNRLGAVAALEERLDSRIGLHARNVGTGATLAHRADDREAMCSTFKALAAATVLRRGIDLDRVVRYSTSDLVEYSPITGERRRMTVGELCDAAIRYSDNTAGNLLLGLIGGPRGLTRDLRRLGDRVTRLDRWETELNTAIPGDPRDTSTPRALATTYRRLTLGDGLTGTDRWALRGWLEANTTSVKTFRAGLPQGWWSADKTGSGSYGVTNCAGLVSAPDGTQIVFAALTRLSALDGTRIVSVV
ncbi:class A beta-lactamase [Janibacter sp. G349]|uniref:class A beta-lactamase n=1 Tax=Janibacter sp. G349 TaxID=3405424 RepID=UPI003B7B0B32